LGRRRLCRCRYRSSPVAFRRRRRAEMMMPPQRWRRPRQQPRCSRPSSWGSRLLSSCPGCPPQAPESIFNQCSMFKLRRRVGARPAHRCPHLQKLQCVAGGSTLLRDRWVGFSGGEAEGLRLPAFCKAWPLGGMEDRWSSLQVARKERCRHEQYHPTTHRQPSTATGSTLASSAYTYLVMWDTSGTIRSISTNCCTTHTHEPHATEQTLRGYDS